MSKNKEAIGKEIGFLTVLDTKRKVDKKGRLRTYYLCKCKLCNKEKWIRSDTLKVGSSCGCLSKNTQFKANNITNKKFGRLTAIKATNKRAENNSIIWKCKCDCGNYKEVAEYLLTSNRVRSCGCMLTESSKKNIKKAIEVHLKEHIIDNTNIQTISQKEPLSNSKTKVRGVYWDESKNKYKAQIEFKKVHYNLGYYDNIEDAEKAYIEAKEKLHKKFLEELDK
ncbi:MULTISPECIES: AP2 domain-containing protein [unclassified Clostridioides]|uniref:AP2 domain-containing protein n=1 Tax=unclassified Clostridioides TaxID=2635829 RepID=UPI001D117D6A|nr:AP2 domain-containing protein [Clostridioides sp. ZZV14-6153]MCC0739312.1 AP2 domain-containing protein [Clostridioides sp. ZZV14-5902]